MSAHEHVDDVATNDPNNFYEVCACNASRRRPKPGDGADVDPWHLCSACVSPGFEHALLPPKVAS